VCCGGVEKPFSLVLDRFDALVLVALVLVAGGTRDSRCVGGAGDIMAMMEVVPDTWEKSWYGVGVAWIVVVR